jgi:hypothetical protein
MVLALCSLRARQLALHGSWACAGSASAAELDLVFDDDR